MFNGLDEKTFTRPELIYRPRHRARSTRAARDMRSEIRNDNFRREKAAVDSFLDA